MDRRSVESWAEVPAPRPPRRRYSGLALSGAGLLALGIPLIAIAASRGAERYLLREEGTTDEICLGILQVTRG